MDDSRWPVNDMKLSVDILINRLFLQVQLNYQDSLDPSKRGCRPSVQFY